MVIRSVNVTFFLQLLLTVNPLLCAAAQNEKKEAIPEPEGLGAIFFIDSSKAALLALERQTAKASAGLVRVSAEIKGERSPVRILSDLDQDFVVALPSGVDPSKYELFLMEAKKGKRRTVMATDKIFTVQVGKSSLAVTVKRYGGSSYKLTPAQRLPPGEYCFSPSDSNDSFCFGIDPLNLK
jgi:hypothetical protein